MNTTTVAPRAPAVKPLTAAQLQREARWQRDAAEIHWSVCRTCAAGRHCQRYEDLDVAAFTAERLYLEVSRG